MTEYINKRKAHIYCADSMLAGDITKKEADLIDDFLEGCSTIEIVHCEDCMHFEPYDEDCERAGMGDCNYFDAGDMNDNDYCRYGERREDG